MADNTKVLNPEAIPSGGGDLIATDDIGGVKYQRVKLVTGEDGVNDGDISSANPLPITQGNVISSLNSRAAATLAAGAVFQGVEEDVSAYGRVGVSIVSDNATDGVLTMEVSRDNVTWGGPTRTWSDTRFAQPHMWNIVEKYFRIKYTNGTTEATNLAIQVQYSNNADILLGHQLDETLLDETEAIITRSVLVGQINGGVYKNVPVNYQGRLQVDLPETAFGELNTAEKTAQVQLKFPYGIDTSIAQSLTNHGSSTVTVSGGVASVTCAGAHPAFSQIRSLDVIRYGPGQGAIFLGTCAFTTGVALSSQVFGPGDDDEGLYFGYNGTSFGVMRRYGGQLEVRTLQITAGSDAGGGDFTITMDGTAVTVTVGANQTISQVCAAIVALADEFGNAGRGWEVHTDDNVSVEFISLVAENATGTFSFADVDSGVTAGTFNQATTTIEGVEPTETWVAQASWNVDVMDGSGSVSNPSGIALAAGNGGGTRKLDINMLNVFKIQYQYLGAGMISFGIEDPDNGKFQIVHEIRYAGTSSLPTLVNPTLNLNLIAKTESGYSGGALTMKTASMAGFIEGTITDVLLRRSAKGTETTTGTTPVNVLTIHNEIDFQGARNKIFALLDHVTIASEATKTVTISVIRNVTELGGTPSLTTIDSNSPMEYDVAGTTIVGGEELLTFTLSGVESKDLDIEHLGIVLRPGDRITFGATLSSGSNAEVTVATSWHELV